MAQPRRHIIGRIGIGVETDATGRNVSNPCQQQALAGPVEPVDAAAPVGNQPIDELEALGPSVQQKGVDPAFRIDAS
ncbi:hypothetical protein GCM10010862_53280 [Devosia nitrariae]|uniref:Uncharacterized protein n=1 Tax=Devosia nitrariae TaxID=2071872 RepID=A0ABQ5WE64_9HYPH|nr:hypothetical protein GCM10010862_53280 [Devosia nitrariae]